MARFLVFALLCFFGMGGIANEPVNPAAKKTSLQRKKRQRGYNRVYLATFPRSGNRWMRSLIEEATRDATSCVYKGWKAEDLPDIFPWGGYCCDHGYAGNCRYPNPGDVVVIKTHFPALDASVFDELPYFRAVRVIRHPVDSFYSFYVWTQDFHQRPSEQLFPKSRINEYIDQWRQFNQHWDAAKDVINVRYEDLLSDPHAALEGVLAQIGYKVSPEDIERAVAKYPPHGGALKHFTHFTEEDLKLIEAELGDLMPRYGYTLTEILPFAPQGVKR